MLLAIDIGNTNITFGLFKQNKLVKVFNIPTKSYNIGIFKKKLGKLGFSDTIICSVVPKITRVLAHDLRGIVNTRALVVGQDIMVPIKNCYRKPKQVGQDRLVNAYAGVKLYGKPLVVVDFGTAVTFDVISNKGEYLGGMIIPGLGVSLDALSKYTALLPKVRLEPPKEFIGRDTKSSILSGVVYGYAALCDDLSARIKSKIGTKAKVIGTGGNVALIGKYCKSLDRVNKNLTLLGLNLLNKRS
ncbi:MAG: type III pantothenate kinase [Candidatus Omnitrophica bacterium]|nr:type III pantothenate kinase [Candidatus Omnitrophota bacterium]